MAAEPLTEVVMCNTNTVIDDVREKKGNKPLLALSSPASYPTIETGQTFGLAVFWLFVIFAESQIKASERDPDYCKKNGCETLFFSGNL